MPRINGSLPGRSPVLRALIDICGPDFARIARPADAVAGRRASFVAIPGTARSVVDTLGLAADRNLAPIARGSGSKIDWGMPPRGVDLIIDTGRLGGMWGHHPELRTAEVGAGTQVRALQAALALRGQRLAVDPPTLTATVGGMLATGESGPMRYRFGGPAEHVRRVTYVDRSGEVTDSDGQGNRPPTADLPGVLMSASLRLQPLPALRRWVSIAVSTPLQVHHLVADTLAAQIDPSGIEVDLPAPVRARATEQPPGTLAVLLEGDGPDVAARAARLSRALGAEAAVSAIAPSWWGRYPFGTRDVVLRIAVLIENLHAAVYALRDAAGQPVPIRGSAGSGRVHAVLPGTFGPDRIASVLDSVRSVLMARSGRAVVVTAPPEIARQVDMASRRDLF